MRCKTVRGGVKRCARDTKWCRDDAKWRASDTKRCRGDKKGVDVVLNGLECNVKRCRGEEKRCSYYSTVSS